MLKQTSFIFLLFFSIPLHSHGLGQNTFISLINQHYQAIDNFCINYRSQKKHPLILTYKKNTKKCCASKVKSVATSKANCYFTIGFDANNAYTDITCTPDQEFYSVTAQKWVPAYQLKVHEELLTKNNVGISITHIELIDEPVEVFVIEVKKTHTFFVGRHGVLTHNIILPLGISMSIPFGSAMGCAVGGFFGPVTCTIGIIAGSVIGTIIKIVNEDKIPTYKLPCYDIAYLNNYHAYLNHNTKEDPQILGTPTTDDGYEHPKNWDGKKARHPKSGKIGWPDSNGDVWVPTKPNSHGGPHWDVQDKKGKTYRNVYPGGKVRKGKR